MSGAPGKAPNKLYNAICAFPHPDGVPLPVACIHISCKPAGIATTVCQPEYCPKTKANPDAAVVRLALYGVLSVSLSQRRNAGTLRADIRSEEYGALPISLFAQLNKETVNRAVRPIFIAIKLAERKTHERHNDFKGWDNN